MKTCVVSFADEKFRECQKKLEASALKFGADEVRSYSPDDLYKTGFYQKNKSVLDQKRGRGYWLWKPFFILEALKAMDYGDIVIYSDAGIKIIDSLEPLKKIALEKEIVLFSNDEHLNCEYTKRDCFILMGCDFPNYHLSKQIQASFQVYKKSEKSVEFVKKWLGFCENDKLLTDRANTCGEENFPCFVEHRHDQSILSLLAQKEGLEIFRDPCQWGNYSKVKEMRVFGEFLQRPYSGSPFLNSVYPQITNHHRNQKVKSVKGFVWKLRQKVNSYKNSLGL